MPTCSTSQCWSCRTLRRSPPADQVGAIHHLCLVFIEEVYAVLSIPLSVCAHCENQKAEHKPHKALRLLVKQSRCLIEAVSSDSAESPDGGGALLPDGGQEDHHLPPVQPASELLCAPLEPHDLQRGPAACSAAVSFIYVGVWSLGAFC